ncbi:MAG: DUF4041 domain-containing protein [Idiomarina sp.]|nr:DUF4041 domain-containing protein [Idiomarina sp.]
MMLYIPLVGALIASAAFTVFSYVQLRKIKPSYLDAKQMFAEVDENEAGLNRSTSIYRVLQTDYSEDRRELLSHQKLVSQYDIGIGTVDERTFKRTTDFAKLDTLIYRLQRTKDLAKSLIKDKQACVCLLGSDLQVNGSKAKARTLINREIKLRIRCFDNEVKAAIALADWNNIGRLIARVKRRYEEINENGRIAKTQLRSEYRDLKVTELQLEYEIRQLKADIKEAEKEERRLEREGEREEAKIKRAAEKAKSDRERMEKLVQKELDKLENATQEQKELYELHRQELEVLKERESRAISMAQRTRAGYVYVISNPVSFGPDIIKIGMTRRVDPQDRVRELGDASVPELFDVHAFFYSEDAPSLEAEIHRKFADDRVNLVNRRKEFFNVPADKAISAIETSGVSVERTV